MECSNEEDKISEDISYVEPEGGLQGRKRKATVTTSKLRTTGIENQAKKCGGKCLRAENEMLWRQLVRKMKELEAAQIRVLNLKLNVKNVEIKSLKKQIGELRAENEDLKKTAKLPRNPRLCKSCNNYVVGHDYRNCPERRASASSEQDEGDDSN